MGSVEGVELRGSVLAKDVDMDEDSLRSVRFDPRLEARSSHVPGRVARQRHRRTDLGHPPLSVDGRTPWLRCQG
jgi:hypothetical protein